MVEVSDKFMQLAQENGRHVRCRIEAGGEVFLDDRIIEFDFDDVVHPDWFTLGTTCANRFYFVAKFDGMLNVHDLVRPFISFDGEEWCPLGMFYISRRYVRGSYVSITCYDRMYSLDMEYSSALSLPTDSAAVLEEICTAHGIPCEDFGGSFEVTEIPSESTVRDMIGYIASLNRACAKISRTGALVLKKHEECGFPLRDNNCMDIRRNMDRSVVTCLKCDTGSEELESGAGAEISTLELYNPLMTQKRLDTLYHLMRPFSFYGAEVEMQGMPFLEAGDFLWLLEKDMLYPMVISEIEYHYDGGLTAVLYSKNKTYQDAAVTNDDLEAALAALRAALSVMCLTHTNEQQLAISTDPTAAVDFTLETACSTFAQLDLNISVSRNTAEFLVFRLYVNGGECVRQTVHGLSGASRHLVHFCHTAELPKGSNHIYVTLQTTGGDAYILSGQLFSSLVAHGASVSGSGDGKVSAADMVPPLAMGDFRFILSDMTDSMTTEIE